MISRIHCVTCKADTLHQGMTCIHCGNSQIVTMRERKKSFSDSKKVHRPYSIEFCGELLSLKEIAKRSGVAYKTITFRFRNGLRGDRLVEKVTPMRARPKVKSAA